MSASVPPPQLPATSATMSTAQPPPPPLHPHPAPQAPSATTPSQPQLLSAPASPASSQEKLDWGSIDEEDGAYAHRPSLLAADSPELAEGSAGPQGSPSSTGGHGQSTVKTFLSPNQNLKTAVDQPKKQVKLKSVLILPDRSYESEQDRRSINAERQQQLDLSQEWKVVKPKRRHGAAGRGTSGGGSMRRAHAALPPSSMARSPPDYKKLFRGKCFRCLASDHKVAHCHDPPRCLNYLGSGHLARHCNALLGRKRNIQSRLTFPPGSIHNCLTFSDLSYAQVTVSSFSSASMAQRASFVGSPRQRPLIG
jgi:hypothetical protein